MKFRLYSSKQLDFVEFNITGSNNDYIRCDSGSSFLDSIIFNVFITCFESANKLFDCYNPTKYNSRKLIPLRNELMNNLGVLNKVDSTEKFINLFVKNYMGKDFLDELGKKDLKWKEKWDKYLAKLIHINKQIIKIVEKCADEEKILWVIGY